MFQFIVWLRAIAAIFITNSHYAGIWPISRMALGGMIGNCLYFFVSGFCLYNIKEKFPKWYAKRIIRIYPSLWIASIGLFLVGSFSADSPIAFFYCLIYPTWYHFIASIMFLYIAFYLFIYCHKKWKIDIRMIMALVFLSFIVFYMTRFERNILQIEDVEQRYVRFHFMEVMLMGAFFRERYETISKDNKVFLCLNAIVSFVVYSVCKVVIPRNESMFKYQIIFPLIMIWMIWSIGLLFIKLEKTEWFKKVNPNICKVVTFIAYISLEIYLCQNVLITRNSFAFPISFIVVTGTIIFYAWIVHTLSLFVQKKIKKIIE
ncbi:MAG: acyltransferase [Lachnospiraceae bacterium]|nr:acyltransferase [Lachnospiraceae bacterium]